MGKRQKCKGCIYSFSDAPSQYYCIYILIERKKRPCEGGNKCTVKRKYSDMSSDESIAFRRKRETYLSLADYGERMIKQ